MIRDGSLWYVKASRLMSLLKAYIYALGGPETLSLTNVCTSPERVQYLKGRNNFALGCMLWAPIETFVASPHLIELLED